MRVAEVSSGEINHVQIPATLTEFLQFPPLSATEEKQCHLLPNFRANLPNKVSRVPARSRPARVFGAAFSDGVHLSARNDRLSTGASRQRACARTNAEARYVYVCIYNRIESGSIRANCRTCC